MEARDELFDAASFEAWQAPSWEPVEDEADRALPSALLRIERIEEVELPGAATEAERRRLLAELDSLLDVFGTVGDFREGESLADRNARILARDAAMRQVERPSTESESDPTPIEQEWAKERDRELRRLPIPGRLGSDVAAVRRFLCEQLEAADVDVDAHLRPPRRGRPTRAVAVQRAVLAPIFAEASARGATLEALAVASHRALSTVAALVAAGRGARKSETAAPLSEGPLSGGPPVGMPETETTR